MGTNYIPEYESLRQEILELFQREFQSITIGLTAVGAILGFGLSQPAANPYFSLIPIIILSLVLLQLKQCHYSILHIAVYIRIRYTPLRDTDCLHTWESFMHHLRMLASEEKKYNPLTSFSMIHYFVVGTILAGMLCILISTMLASRSASGTATFYFISGTTAVYWVLLSSVVFYMLRDKSLWQYEQDLEKKLSSFLSNHP